MPGGASKRTSLADDYRKWGSATERRFKDEHADLCKRLNNLCGSDFNSWEIDGAIRFALTRHGTAHANLTLLKTYPELLEAIGQAAGICAMEWEWDPRLEAEREPMKKVIEVYRSVIQKASERGCTKAWNTRGYYTGWVLAVQEELNSADLRGGDG